MRLRLVPEETEMSAATKEMPAMPTLPRVGPEVEDELWAEMQDEANKVRVKTAYSRGRIDGLKLAMELVRRTKSGAA